MHSCPHAALTQKTAVKRMQVYDWDTDTIYQRRHIIKVKSFFSSKTDDVNGTIQNVVDDGGLQLEDLAGT